MATIFAIPGLSDAQTLVLTAAEAARVAADGSNYTYGGATPAGFDCSGFVCYVFNQAFGEVTLQRQTADDYRTGAKFSLVTTPAPGDLVFFSKNGATASHVGIVVDNARWIGSQTSTGVAYVQFSNSYWKPLFLSYGRYTGMQASDAIAPARAGNVASLINK